MIPRPYESSSSLALADRCLLAYVLRYHAGVREADVPWSQIERDPASYSSRQRSTALGKEAHARLEAYCACRPVTWIDLPGQVAARWVPLLPSVRGAAVVVEGAIGGPVPRVIDQNSGRRIPALALPGDAPCWLVGYRDLGYGFRGAPITAAQVPDWSLGALPGGCLTVDLKTSGSIADWAIQPEDLPLDLQCCAYVYDACRATGIREHAVRWAYSQTRGAAKAEPRDAIVTAKQAARRLREASDVVTRIRGLSLTAPIPANLRGCDQYGGCYYCREYNADGVCPVIRSTGQLIALLNTDRERIEIPMALTPELAARAAAAKARIAGDGAAPAATPRVVPRTAPVSTGDEAPEQAAAEDAPPVAAPRGRPRKRPASAAVEPPDPPPPAEDGEDPIAAAYDNLAAARADLAEAEERVAAAKAALVETLS